jgi:hypothetical protein
MYRSASALIPAVLSLLAVASAPAQVLLSDNYNITGSGTGFALGSGANSGINPPTTRLGGSSAPNMRYLVTDSTKALSSYSITGNKLQVASAANSGRFSLSSDGATVFDFGSALTADLASSSGSAVYELSISMANNSAGIQRFSFALGTAENNANFWDFGIQLYRANAADTFYTIGKRIDRVSYTTATDSTGTTADINAAITTTAAGTFGTQLNFLMRVTDAGAESTTFNSRVQVSMDGGTTWFYDTQTDSALTSGFRFDTANRYIMFDIAASSAVTYDNLSVNLVTAAVPEPSSVAFAGVALLALAFRRLSR